MSSSPSRNIDPKRQQQSQQQQQLQPIIENGRNNQKKNRRNNQQPRSVLPDLSDLLKNNVGIDDAIATQIRKLERQISALSLENHLLKLSPTNATTRANITDSPAAVAAPAHIGYPILPIRSTYTRRLSDDSNIATYSDSSGALSSRIKSSGSGDGGSGDATATATPPISEPRLTVFQSDEYNDNIITPTETTNTATTTTAGGSTVTPPNRNNDPDPLRRSILTRSSGTGGTNSCRGQFGSDDVSLQLRHLMHRKYTMSRATKWCSVISDITSHTLYDHDGGEYYDDDDEDEEDDHDDEEMDEKWMDDHHDSLVYSETTAPPPPPPKKESFPDMSPNLTPLNKFKNHSLNDVNDTTIRVSPKLSLRRHSVIDLKNIKGNMNSTLHLNDYLSRLFLGQTRFEPSFSPLSSQSFRRFAILSLTPATVAAAASQLECTGKTYLDPFTIRGVCDVIDRFPLEDDKDDKVGFDPQTVAAFTFPSGLSVRLIPRCALDGAKKRLGWGPGRNADKYYSLTFTNENGGTTHAVAMTVMEELCEDSSQGKNVKTYLREARRRRRAARCIALWWKLLRERSLEEEIMKRSSGVSHGIGVEDRFYVSLRAEKTKKKKIKSKIRKLLKMPKKSIALEATATGNGGGDGLQSSSHHSTTVTTSTTQSHGPLKTKIDQYTDLYHADATGLPVVPISERKHRGTITLKYRQNGAIQTSTVEQDTNIIIHHHNPHDHKSSSLPPTYITSHDNIKIKQRSRSDLLRYQHLVMGSPKQRAAESYDNMTKNFASGDVVCLVQKCFVFLGVKDGEQALVFEGLRRLVEWEREERMLHLHDKNEPVDNNAKNNINTRNSAPAQKISDIPSATTTTKSNSRHGSIILDPPPPNKTHNYITEITSRRRQLLSFIQNNLQLTPAQSSIKPPPFALLSQFNTPPKFQITLPIPQSAAHLSLPLPLPLVSADYGLSTLLLSLHSATHLILSLKLLLVERSVLILGRDPIAVTSASRALLELLHPFRWSSTFLPLLPGGMMEFLSSPVPFVAGMVLGREELNGEGMRDWRTQMDIREAMAVGGMGVLHLDEGSLYMMNGRDDVVSCEVQLNFGFGLRNTLDSLKARLSHLSLTTPALRSFPLFLEHGLPPSACITLQSIRHRIQHYFRNMSEMLTETIDPLLMEERGDGDNNNVNCASSLYQSLVEPSRALAQFQEQLVDTQLFTVFVDDWKKKEKSRRERMVTGDEGKKIAMWVERQWGRRRR